MRAGLIWTIILLIVVLVALIKIGIRVNYVGKDFRMDLKVSRFCFALIGEEKSKKPKKQKENKKSPPPVDKKKTGENVKKGSILENPWVKSVLDYWQELLSLIGRVLVSPTLDTLYLHMKIGGGDAEKCAMKYGKICAILGGVLPVVENTFGIRKRDIQVWCCYDRDDIDISAETSITIRVFEIFALVFAVLGLGIRILLQARKYKKAV